MHNLVHEWNQLFRIFPNLSQKKILEKSVIFPQIWPKISLIGIRMDHFCLKKLLHIWVLFQIPSSTSLPKANLRTFFLPHIIAVLWGKVF